MNNWEHTPIYAGMMRARNEQGELATAASETDNFARSMRPVTLEPERDAEFENFFFNAASKSDKRDFLKKTLEAIAENTYNINLFFEFMRRCVFAAGSISRQPPEQAAERVKDIFAGVYGLRTKSGESISKSVSIFLRATRINSGSFHNVYRSQRYPDGVDILLNSVGDDSHLKWPAFFGSTQADEYSFFQNYGSNNYHAKTQRADWFQTPFGNNVILAAKEINQLLFGSSLPSDRPVHQGLNLSFRFSEVQEIFERTTGITLPQELVSDMQVESLLADQFLQVEFMRMPSKRAADIAKEVRRDFASAGSTDNNSLIKNRMDSDEYLSREAEILNVVARTTLRFTLEPDIARYVAQNLPNERVSLTRVNTWFTQYIGQVLRAASDKAKVRDGIPAVTNAASINIKRIPRYVMSASTLKKLSDIRAQNGFVVEQTKSNAEGLYITPQGTFAAKGSVDDFKKSTLAEDYERLSEEILEIVSRNGLSLAEFQLSPRAAAFPYIDSADAELLAAKLKELRTYNGTVIGYDWDFGITVVATSEPGITTTRQEIGSVKPDALTVADYLGYNLAREGEKPMIRDFATSMTMLTSAVHPAKVKEVAFEKYSGANSQSSFYNSTAALDIVALYIQLAYQDKKAPQLDEIIKSSMRVLGITTLPERDNVRDYSRDYLEFLEPSGKLKSSGLRALKDVPRKLLEGSMVLASAKYGSWLWKKVQNDLGANATSREITEELHNDPDYFNPTSCTMADFTRLYTYFGGQVWKQIMDAVNAVPIGEHFGTHKVNGQFDATPKDATENDEEASIYVTRKTNAEIMRILPYTQMLANYATNKETIFAQADEYVESIRPTEGFDSSDIKVPGLVDDDPRAVFPHQAEVQAYLRKPVPPPFAILALDPGGGKTGQGVIDIACIVRDMQAVDGGVVRPLVICPNGLINQWCEDLRYFQGSNWNAFPLSSDVMNRWGQDKLLELAKAAPPNTLFIASMSFIQGRPERLCIGNASVGVSYNMEFVRRLGCSYIAIDESHNLKNFSSARHRSVKLLTTATSVRWKRILTGTLMPDRAKDIEGQIALHSPAIFRAGEIASIGPNDVGGETSVKLGDNNVVTYNPLNAKRAVDKLSHYAAFIVKKRKEWAFMLPAPIETFHAIGLEHNPDAEVKPFDYGKVSAEELDLQRKHIELYEHVLKETEDALADLLKAKEKADKKRDGAKDSDSDDNQEEEEEEEGGSGGSDKYVENDNDFAGENIVQALWEKNLQRFERMIMSPMEDDAYEQIFGKGTKFVSRKVKMIMNLVHTHFHTPAWQQGKEYREYDLVSEGDKLYVAKKYDKGAEYVLLPESTRKTPPSKNPEYWKLEPEGKLIIITRYNRSARTIYDTLDPMYRSQAVVFTGDEPDKHKGFNEFKTNPKVKILIANEQGMSEGHNLQIASRIIRTEAPWGPGALSQTAARIFRPDPKGALAASKGEGEMVRDVIYLDWVLANETMEVPKLARVISKSFGVTRFTEADNPLYKEVLKTNVPTERECPELSLGLKMLRNIYGLDDENAPFKAMAAAYRRLNKVENAEFKEMRSKQVARLLPIEAAPNVDGARKMEVVPFVANQPIPDPNGWTPQNLEESLRDPELLADVNQLVGRNVITEFGPGRIVSVKKPNSKGNVTSVKVRFKNPPVGFINEWESFSPNLVYIATTVSPQDFAKYFDVPLDANETAAKKSDRENDKLRKQQEEQERQEQREEEIRKKQEKKRISVRQKDRVDGEKREDNIKKGKDANDGIYETKDAVIPTVPKGSTVVVSDEHEDMVVVIPEGAETGVRLYPAYYHGFATLEAELDDEVDPAVLKALGFIHTPSYAFVEISNKKKFFAFYEFLDNNFDLSDKTVDMISGINRSFETGMTNTHKLWYKMELAPIAELPSFFASSKRMVKNRNEVRVFPVFVENHVMLCIDIRTNPAIVPFLGKTIKGTGTKLNKADGHWFYFGKNKTDLRNMIATVKRNGYNLLNQKDAIKELTEIQFKYKKS